MTIEEIVTAAPRGTYHIKIRLQDGTVGHATPLDDTLRVTTIDRPGQLQDWCTDGEFAPLLTESTLSRVDYLVSSSHFARP